MQIESVTAVAFGPFSNRTLQLCPGMTVIYGPNESGKSTWHAALYAGLCGIRRGRGKSRQEDEYFEDRHRPWDAKGWEVSAIVTLADGRRLELRHDLSNKVSWVRDADLGRDCSGEIIHEGSPDGACWLGLDRRSFLGTACVRQAEIQSVLDDPNALQEHMQRAASTASTDATAAAALVALADFRRDNVGQDKRNRTKPLRIAKEASERAQSLLEEARHSHADYVLRMEEVERLKNDVERAEHALRVVEAARARREASQALTKLDRARELASKYSEPPPPENQNEEKVRTARLVLDRWSNRPASVELSGLTAQELQDRLAQLPVMPEGDVAPHPNVVRAKNKFQVAQASLERHQLGRPAEAVQVCAEGLTLAKIRSIASELSLQEPSVAPLLQERLERAQTQVESFSQPKRQTGNEGKPSNVPLILRPFVLVARFLIRIIRSFFRGKPDAGDTIARLQAMEELHSAQAALGEVRFRVDDIRQRRQTAKTEASARGLPEDSAALNELAGRVEEAERAAFSLTQWREQERSLKEEMNNTEAALEAILRARGMTITRPLLEALEAYEAACGEHDHQAREASRRPELELAHASRKHQEALAADAERMRKEASVSLRQAGEGLDVQRTSDEELAVGLQKWLDDYDRAAPNRRRATEEWDELQNLLADGSINDLEGVAAQRRKAAEEFAQGINVRELEEVVLDVDAETQLRTHRQAKSSLREALTDKQARLDEFARAVPSVAEAEEEVTRSQAELERVMALDMVLATTQGFLEKAQDKVHRTLAPRLRNSLKPWLQSVTGGRYSDATVDAETLMVQVSGDGKHWRRAALLSHGTAEQIYLLLRVAMARLLTKPGEVCPLLFDDVTVHSDPARRNGILEILYDASREQQVILFSQEAETLAWAKGHLMGERDRLIELDAKGILA